MRSLRSLHLAAFSFLAAAAADAQMVHVAKTAAGVAVDWDGGNSPSDVVAIDLGAVAASSSLVDLGTVRSVECGSTDKTTRNGHEDTTVAPNLVAYLVGTDGNYGPAGDGRARRIDAGDCSSGPLTQSQFCNRWKNDSRITTEDCWSGNSDPNGCDQGAVSADAIQDALRRTNLYRWMAGLDPVTEDAVLDGKCQQGATLLRGLGYLTHQPEPGSPCYTSDGDVACGSSNICAGYPTLADAVDAYLADFGIDTLGHRRWLLHPPLQKTGFGFVEGSGTFAVQWIIGSGSPNLPAFVAWPSPGWFPTDAPLGRWSFSAKNANFSAATVTVTNIADGRPLQVSGVGALPTGYSWACLAYDVSGAVAGEAYRVSIDGVQGTTQAHYEYTTTWCNCP
jgi:hypothetical protein